MVHFYYWFCKIWKHHGKPCLVLPLLPSGPGLAEGWWSHSMQTVPEGVLHLTQKGKLLFHCISFILSVLWTTSHFKLVTYICVCSTTAETAGTSTAATAPATNWPCLPTLGLCGCATCATPSCYREAPKAPDITPTSVKCIYESSLLTTLHMLIHYDCF